MFIGILIYTVVVIFCIEWCIRKLCSVITVALHITIILTMACISTLKLTDIGMAAAPVVAAPFSLGPWA